MIIRINKANNFFKELELFFKRNINKYKNDDATLANLYFYNSLTCYNDGSKKEALKFALLAKDYFIKTNIYEDNKATIDDLIAMCQ